MKTRIRTYGFVVIVFLLALSVVLLKTLKTSAADLPVVNVSGTLASSQTWTAGNVYMVQDVIIPSGVTLTINAGAIVKAGNPYAPGITVNGGGNISAIGTNSNRIIFTSHKDDLTGGDSNGDGNYTTPNDSDYSVAIFVNGGNAVLRFTTIAYGTESIQAIGATTANLSVTDSNLKSQIHISSFNDSNLTFERNHIETSETYNAMVVHSLDLSAIILSGANKNTFTGSGRAKNLDIGSSSRVAPNKSWTVDGGENSPILYISAALEVEGALTLNPGVVIKVGSSWLIHGISVKQDGVLNVQGTITDKVTFTSYQDDSVGGDSNGDGNYALPSKFDYGAAIMASDGSVMVSSANFRYGSFSLIAEGDVSIEISNSEVSFVDTAYQISASPEGSVILENILLHDTGNALRGFGGKIDLRNVSVNNVENGLSTSGTARVTFRGSITNVSGRAIEACNWQAAQGDAADCHVDAAYVDWGVSTGPFAPFATNYVCGSVNVSPWVGGSSDDFDAAFDSPNCDGTPTPEQELATAVQAYNDRMDALEIDCSGGFQDACDQMQRTFQCLSSAVDVASSGSPVSFPVKPTIYSRPSSDVFKGDLTRNVGSYMKSSAENVPQVSLFKLANIARGIVGTFWTLSNAYNNCN